MGTPIKIETEFVLEEQFLSDVLVTAFDSQYGGCWYWAQPRPQQNPKDNAFKIEEDVWRHVVIIEQGEPTTVYIIDHEMIGRGIKRIINGEFSISRVGSIINAPDWARMSAPARAHLTQVVFQQDAGQIDSDDADHIVQVAIFGHVMYG